MTDPLIPAVIVSPGEILRAELEAREMTQKDLAMIMGRPEQMISEIINAKKQITPDTAIDLEQALGISAQFWLNLESAYQLHLAQHHARDEAIARRARLFSLLPLKKMARRGWLDLSGPADEIEHVVERFLGLSPLDQEPALATRFRYSTIREPHMLALLAWVRRVEQLAGQPVAGSFSKDGLQGGIADLLRCAARAEDVARVPAMLDALGVQMVVLPHLGHTYLDGAACLVAGHPVLAMTLRHDRVDSFWFTLLHEIAHLLEDDAPSYLDVLPSPGDGNGATGSEAWSAEEASANRRATDWLTPPQAWADFVEETEPYFSLERIEAFAQSLGRHPGIILGRLMHDQKVKFSHLRRLLVKVSPYLEGQIAA